MKWLLLSALTAKAQPSSDFGVWSSIEINKKFNKKWSVNGEAELRTGENSSEIGRWGLKVGGDYNVIKEVKVGLAYQFLYFHDIEYWDFQPRHRFIGFLQGRKKWGNFSFLLRERFQMTTKDDSDRIKASGKIDTYKMDSEWSWRNRIKVSYDIPNCKFAPSVSFESFYQLNNPDGNEFDGLRYTLSVAYKLNKKHSFDLSGIFDKEINVKNPVDRYILNVGYAYSF
ncbi:DUF2490 domain-containing protein [Dysgonomonas sp. GY75]|uniref:DUF2490 domain-containing protein n=1 Tax=Dysgonomonas sp. GY75 TaxID=2780419 RepID=UPI0018842ED9|nr:DUF2490 domain-containing protein [Dysgonomonas sp. GY75]MBF0647371.1 DUF2490 domain-containing protein [Dysgonomonas sp. GY75]